MSLAPFPVERSLMNGLLLEGIPSAGTWKIVQQLQDHPAWRRRKSKLILSESHTHRANDHLRSRTPESYRALMQRSLRALQSIGHVEIGSPLFEPGGVHDLCYVIERFHLTNALMYADGDFVLFQDIDRELARMNCRLALLTVHEMMIEPRLAEFAQMRDDRFTNRAVDHTHRYTVMQEAYRATANESAMISITVDTTDGNWRRCAEEIVRFWCI